jgi:hypothetical protein
MIIRCNITAIAIIKKIDGREMEAKNCVTIKIAIKKENTAEIR